MHTSIFASTRTMALLAVAGFIVATISVAWPRMNARADANGAAPQPEFTSAELHPSAKHKALFDEVLAQTTDEQRAAIADYVVTYDENEAATLAVVACGEAAGFTADVIPGDGVTPTRYSFRVGASGPDDTTAIARFNAAFGACTARHSNDVSALWALTHPGPAQQPACSNADSAEEVVRCRTGQ